MAEKGPEIFDQEQQPEAREAGKKYSQEFQEFVKPGVGEVESQQKSDNVAVEQARKTLQVDTPPNPIKPTEGILADQYHNERIANSTARNSRPEKQSHLKAKIMAGLVGVAGVLGIVHKASDRQEEVDKIKDAENAARVKVMKQNEMSQKIEYDDHGHVKATEVSDGTKYEVKQ